MNAQEKAYDESTILLKDALMGGIHIHPKGWGVNFAIGRQNTVDKMNLYGIEIVGMKHHKEIKRFNQFLEDSKGYAYGKLNSFYIVRPSIGRKKMITDKIRKNGVELGITTRFGPSLGLTKPIYLEIYRPDDDFRTGGDFTTAERYDPDEHNLLNIYGKASAFRGLGEMKLHPGLFADIGMIVEYSPYQRGLKAIEAGIMADYYFDRVPMMAFEENKSLFLNFYINVLFGKKYNRNIKE